MSSRTLARYKRTRIKNTNRVDEIWNLKKWGYIIMIISVVILGQDDQTSEEARPVRDIKCVGSPPHQPTTSWCPHNSDKRKQMAGFSWTSHNFQVSRQLQTIWRRNKSSTLRFFIILNCTVVTLSLRVSSILWQKLKSDWILVSLKIFLENCPEKYSTAAGSRRRFKCFCSR